MCTFILAWQVFADAPVVAAATRDEAHDRPSDPPGRYRDEPRIVAPRDSRAGGTWIGVNEFGVLVAVTNRWTDADLAGDRSRGRLVADALACESAAAARDLVADSVSAHEYDGFYLAVADAETATVCSWDGAYEETDLEPGVSVLVNVGLASDPDVPAAHESRGRDQAENAAAVGEALTPESGETAAAWLERARTVMADHDYGVCRHGDEFGTRSASLIALGSNPIYRYADGPPCETSLADVGLESHI